MSKWTLEDWIVNGFLGLITAALFMTLAWLFANAWIEEDILRQDKVRAKIETDAGRDTTSGFGYYDRRKERRR